MRGGGGVAWIGPTNLMEEIGTDDILFETDFPHPTSLYPGVQEHIEKTLGACHFETRKRVLQGNAVGAVPPAGAMLSDNSWPTAGWVRPRLFANLPPVSWQTRTQE